MHHPMLVSVGHSGGDFAEEMRRFVRRQRSLPDMLRQGDPFNEGHRQIGSPLCLTRFKERQFPDG